MGFLFLLSVTAGLFPLTLIMSFAVELQLSKGIEWVSEKVGRKKRGGARNYSGAVSNCVRAGKWQRQEVATVDFL